MKQRIKLFYLNLFLSAGFVWLGSQNAVAAPLTLDEVLKSTSESFPLVQGARQDMRKAEADFFSSQGTFDPVLKAKLYNTFEGYYQNTYTDLSVEQPTTLWGTKVIAGWRRGTGNFPVYDAKLATFDGGEFRAGIEVPLLRGGPIDERRAKLKVAEKGLEVNSEALQAQELEAKRQATHKYWDWLAAGKKLSIAKQLLEISLTRDEALTHRVKHGDSAQIDQVDNQRAVVQRQSALASAERGFQKASFELSLFYRDSNGNPVVVGIDRLPSTLPEPKGVNELEKEIALVHSQDQSIAQVATQHPDSKKLALQFEQLETEYSLAKNQLLPQLDFSLGYYADFGINPGTSYLPPGNYPNEFKVSLSLEFPILFRSPRGKVASASASLDRLQFQRKLVQDKLSIQLKDSAQAMRTSLVRLGLARTEIAITTRLENAERTRFLHGDSSLFIINLREQTTRDAMIKEVEVLSDFFKAEADYLLALGIRR